MRKDTYHPFIDLETGEWLVHNSIGTVVFEECIDFYEAALLARAYYRGAKTYLEACELEPHLKRYWNNEDA
jgi:hypothetical protein